MKQTCLLKSASLFFLFLLLNACTGVAVKDTGTENRQAYQDRANRLGAVSEWGFAAKISLDDGDQGGSGKLRWEVSADSSTLDFHGAFGRGAWHLEIDPEQAYLKEANGDEQTARDVNELILDRIGWQLPVEALQWWVRGLAAPGDIESENIEAEGLLLNLHQLGWSVVFTRYDSANGLALPIRLNATRDNYRVKLAISRWRMDRGHADIN